MLLKVGGQRLYGGNQLLVDEPQRNVVDDLRQGPEHRLLQKKEKKLEYFTF